VAVVRNDQPFRVAAPFPTPPGSVLRALELLQIARRNDPDEMAEAGDLINLPRPWDPATCPAELREAVWEWCDSVAAWINHEYVWRPPQMIPACWPHHPHIARELAVLAVLRWNAEESTIPEGIEEWHRYALPMFCDRMTNRLGESCRTSKHTEWPAESRYAAFVGEENSRERQHIIHADTRALTPPSGSSQW
jgi:hypothetical protein